MNTLFKTVTSSPEDDNIVALPLDVIDEKHQIIIKDLALDMFIGVLDKEKKKRQRVIINAEITVRNTAKNDDISSVVSYADIIEKIEKITTQEHIKLVETFAQKIIDNCFEDERINAIELSVEKPDIIKNVASVGVKLYKQR